jgi:hypothetical protein
MLEKLQSDFHVRMFSLMEIPEAVAWAERGRIAVHENYHSRRKQSFHVICGDRDELLKFSRAIGMPDDAVKASDNFRFWHLTWFP